ncbi:hypothetical protein BH24CHL4_BH24CHL4_08100 [soil metagenome]
MLIDNPRTGASATFNVAMTPGVLHDSFDTRTIPVLSCLLTMLWSVMRSMRLTIADRWVWLLIEVLVIAAWASFVGWEYLEFSESIVPAGRDFFNNVQGNHTWQHLKDCGLCALWNGDVNGGAPAFADPQSAVWHPFTVVTTLLLGVINGVKVAIVLSLFAAGVGQLWLGYELHTGRAARFSMALIATGAGHVTGPLEGGTTAVSLAIASTSLVIAALMHYVNSPTRRSVAILGVCLGTLLVAGQGYVQIGMVMLAPLTAILVVGRMEAGRLVRDGLAASAIGGLLAGPFLVPFLNIYPDFIKDGDPEFAGGQSLGATALNLVIRDWAFYNTEVLGKSPFGFFHINYVGWFGVFLAILGAVQLWRRNARTCAFLVGFTMGALWLATGSPFRFMYGHAAFLPALRELVMGVRNMPLIAGVAVIPLLGLAAIGFDELFRWRPRYRRLTLSISEASPGRSFDVPLDLRAVLIVLTLVSMLAIKNFTEHWISSGRPDMASVDEVLDPLATEELQWVQPPFGENWFAAFTTGRGLKIADQWRPWWLFDRVHPPAQLVAVRNGTPPESGEAVSSHDDVIVYQITNAPRYASFNGQPGASPCSATGQGGNVDIACDTSATGSVMVLETHHPGWQVTVNGDSQPVRRWGKWLAIDIPAGASTIKLRYRPWDVWIGVALAGIGLVWAAYWIAGPRTGRREHVQVPKTAEDGQEVDFIPYEPDPRP